MASSPVTAPRKYSSNSSSSSSSSPPSPNAPPPSSKDSTDSSSPPLSSSSKQDESSPPPPDSSPPPPQSSQSTPPPPSSSSSSSPPPPSSEDSSPPPPSSSSEDSSPPPPSSSSEDSSPPPPSSEHSSPPPPLSKNSSPPPPSSADDNNSSNSSPSFSPPPPHSSSSSSSSSSKLSPPPPAHKSHSSHTSSNSTSSTTSDNSSSTSSNNKIPLIVGITAGVAVLFIIMILIIVCCRKKKKRRPHNQMQYYSDSHGHKGHGYYNDSAQHPSWHNSPQSNEHAIKVQPPPSGGGWGAPPSGGWPPRPPSPMMGSGEMNSNLYSGPHQAALPPPPPTIALGLNQSTFTYDELAAATNGFSQANLLGQGGFGYVHKGVLATGKIVAVKSLKTGSGQGDREFHAEVDIISRVHHRHLVSLVGYCIAGGQRMLVYDFVPNKTLEYHLHGHDRPTMDWASRLRIALGSAKGLAYLHEDCHPRIIHRDIKAANILLDENFEAMVADFGLAKLSNDNHTHVSTRVMGTFGYLAPEYASSGKLTEKSDVFSFGVMLLELITGKPPVDTTNSYMEDSLVDWARPLMTRALEDGNYMELVDPRLEGNYEPHEMAQMVACASASIRHSGRRRPKMSQIVRALEGDMSLEDLNEGFKPGQSSNFSSSNGSGSDYEKFRKMAMGSRDLESSEFGATSEHTQSSSSGEVSLRHMH